MACRLKVDLFQSVISYKAKAHCPIRITMDGVEEGYKTLSYSVLKLHTMYDPVGPNCNTL